MIVAFKDSGGVAGVGAALGETPVGGKVSITGLTSGPQVNIAQLPISGASRWSSPGHPIVLTFGGVALLNRFALSKMCHCLSGGVALLNQFVVSKMCHCLSALGQAVSMEDRLTIRNACPKADQPWHVQRRAAQLASSWVPKAQETLFEG